MNKTRILLIVAILLMLAGSYFVFFNNRSTSDAPDQAADTLVSDSNSTAAKHRQQIAAEHDHPQDFVQISIDPKKNLLGETVIEGKIINKAELTSYNDFELMIHWNDEAGMPMDSAVEMVLEGLDPKEEVEFKTKRRGPKHSKSIKVTLRAAKAKAH